MQWALAILTVIAYATLPLGSSSFEQQPVPTLLVGLAFVLLAIFGFPFVRARSIWWRAAFALVQLALGFWIYSLSGAAVGASLLLVVLVVQSVLLLPLPAAAVVAAVIPLVHLGMDWQDGIREGLGTLAVTVFTLIVTELLVREQTARAALADANEQLRGYTAQAEQLAAIRERNRLARDIHDGVGHHLTVVQMQLEAARAVLGTAERERIDAMLAAAQEQSGQALAEVRRSVAALRDERPRLEDALRTLVSEATAAGAPAELEIRGEVRPVRAEVDESLFRAAQEGLTNVRKHAHASRTSVVLDFRAEDRIRLEVHDDGRGVPETPGDGFGLTGLRERMANLGGRLTLDSDGATGSTLAVEVPA
ncbi:signal transduction histidine kinase [Agromyces flavus]|uniref:Oxygen sensor histidine kinase NreB n=1 Tax=Agromyces flavus TaxID=589382 RepID=A0A1H1M0A1_9MICO|nr:sensor histidine kinase [Agromyces flavus]MCP2368685.1 signal transduction histidine kinase [Agromyces flavus]GGI48075.1 hypothetical protein GCM10010932_27630 [Agromyces flavus]SDR80233.1 Signal transduction histidine kinase [Agromyces flavus]